MYACISSKTREGLGTCSPREIRCSKIASEAIWDKTRAVVPRHMAHGVFFGCPRMHLLDNWLTLGCLK